MFLPLHSLFNNVHRLLNTLSVSQALHELLIKLACFNAVKMLPSIPWATCPFVLRLWSRTDQLCEGDLHFIFQILIHWNHSTWPDISSRCGTPMALKEETMLLLLQSSSSDCAMLPLTLCKGSLHRLHPHHVYNCGTDFLDRVNLGD